MIITISGTAGSGKSTVANVLAKKLGLKRYSLGDLQRALAKKKGISLHELGELEKKDPTLDKKLDAMQKKLGTTENDFIIDGRLSFHFIPHSLKIFVNADHTLRAKRIMKDVNKGMRKEEQALSIKEMKTLMDQRQEQEIYRFTKYYNVNPYDMKNYDFVFDSTKLNPETMAQEVMDFIAELSESL